MKSILNYSILLFLLLPNINLFSQETKIGLAARLSPSTSSTSTAYFDLHLHTNLYNRHSLYFGLGNSWSSGDLYVGTIGYRYKILDRDKVNIEVGVNYLTNVVITNNVYDPVSISHELELPLILEYNFSRRISVFTNIGYSFQIYELFDNLDIYNNTNFRAGLGIRYNINK